MAGDIAVGHARQQAQPGGQRPIQPHQADHDRRGQQRAAKNQQKQPNETGNQCVGESQDQPAAAQQRQPGQNQPGQGGSPAGFQMGAAQGQAGGNGGGFPRWQPGRRQRGQQAQRRAFGQRPRINEKLADAEHVVQIVNRAGDQMHQPGAEPQAQQSAEQRARQSEQQRLTQDAEEQFPAADAQRPQHAQQGAALHHRKADGVVDQEQAHHQRQQAHSRQIEGKGGAKVRRGLVALRRPFQPQVRRQPGAQFGGQAFASGPFRQDEINVTEPPSVAQQGLRGGDVGDDEAVQFRSV